MQEQIQKATTPGIPGRDDSESLLSLREILQMVFRHKGKIAAFTLVVTAAAAGFFLLRPLTYQAEGMFMVMPFQANDRTNKDLFENSILSHLEYIKSPLVCSRVAAALGRQGIAIENISLLRSVKCKRTPKTSVIRVTASAAEPETAVLIAQAWMDEYMKSVTESKIQKELSNVRNMIKDYHDKSLEMKARAEEMRIQAAKVENDRLITVSRSVDDTELWNKLSETNNEAELKRLSGIQLKSQAINSEYMLVKNALLAAEQDARSALSHDDFYKQVVVSLQSRASHAAGPDNKAAGATNSSPEVESYIQTLLDARDIVALGQAALLPASRGALKNTALVFAFVLFTSCLLAFLKEWLMEEELPAAGKR